MAVVKPKKPWIDLTDGELRALELLHRLLKLLGYIHEPSIPPHIQEIIEEEKVRKEEDKERARLREHLWNMLLSRGQGLEDPEAFAQQLFDEYNAETASAEELEAIIQQELESAEILQALTYERMEAERAEAERAANYASGQDVCSDLFVTFGWAIPTAAALYFSPFSKAGTFWGRVAEEVASNVGIGVGDFGVTPFAVDPIDIAVDQVCNSMAAATDGEWTNTTIGFSFSFGGGLSGTIGFSAPVSARAKRAGFFN